MAEPAAVGPAPVAATYTSRVIAPLQVGLGVVVAAILLAVLVAVGLWPLGVAGCVLLLAVTWYLAAVTLTVSPVEVCVGQGRGKRGLREIRVRDVMQFEVTLFGWSEAIGSSPSPVSNTYVVRAGAGLRIALNDDETLNISARNPDDAGKLLRAAGVPAGSGGGGD
jgi:hypothetical protein